ncbi:FecCD family ABC transporter permease [Streptococcus dysgalactiae]|uniref:FecCD family ABC transporter permease n=1 Tax=Streptococcus dysgalactiae TaxID=1334 RepID=UPI001CF2FA44|nr:iron ABC transporter permease [Streptococcus dysgalactiae]MCB2828770.1 iron ABC transporter permease [Streptococcus dysgalactiae subsp. dysgalactiae]MCB2830567.1 iron ABC transporter permease [Streptococcus dysgalactiae subsp. dysgalactiae]MCB2834724.1 iron ABC transporter permease [Streptococcus dysgalactiae subsp. dysgalactiae]MCB2836910.1 iron ABC transporter permease [Streptococcus dysgalactiae subsp. dysgalactiae]MCB2838970.1 iron ABC transporter permease [Streptococcus dysgalactiae su
MKSFKQVAPFYLGLFLLLLGLILISLSIGESNMSLLSVIKVLLGESNSAMTLIITKIRLPRILAACVGGGSLALSGLLLQSLTRNPLADSGILGINTGAGVTLAIFVSFSSLNQTILSQFLPLFAMFGASLTIFSVYQLSLTKQGKINPTRLMITGVGVTTMLSSLMVALVGNVNRYKVDLVINWLSGQITGDNWPTLTLIAPLLILLWLVVFYQAHHLNIMNLSDDTAIGLGLALNAQRLVTLALATALASLSVLLVGNISFIGLMAGHISKRLVGNDHRLTIPTSLFIGMLILLIADTVGRVYLVGSNIQTGILVSLIGAPYFLYLMAKTK